MNPRTDPEWFARNADRRDRLAAIVADPARFAAECADAVLDGRLAPPRRTTAGMTGASNFCATLGANVDNADLSDADFRAFVRNTLPVVDLSDLEPRRTRP